MTDPNQAVSYPLLIRFAKTGLMRFVGHLDWQAMQMKIFLRAALPLSVGEGPTHRLKIKTSPPTPVGVGSQVEFTYLMLSDPLYPDEALRRLTPHCPQGIEILAVKDAGLLVRKNPFGTIEACGYRVDFGDDTPPGKIDAALTLLKLMTSSYENNPEGLNPEDIKPFWGRISDLAHEGSAITLLAKQLEGETFHGAKCATFLQERLDLPHYPLFTKLDYYRLTPSKRRLFR
jgi:radical SAM-linked protein